MQIGLAFTGFRQEVKFVAQIAADGAGVGGHRHRFQAQPLERAQIGDEHFVVRPPGTRRIQVK